MDITFRSKNSRDSRRLRGSKKPPADDHIRVWTIQPLTVWQALEQQSPLVVDPDSSGFGAKDIEGRQAYDWMRRQMSKRIPGFGGHYPWWAYEHFLDLRFYRWHVPHIRGQPLVRLGLDLPRDQVLLSAYGAWHCILNKCYVPEAVVGDAAENEYVLWEDELASSSAGVERGQSLPEPFQTQMEDSWLRVFDVDARRPSETIQACFERLSLTDVVAVEHFVSQQKTYGTQ